jgi:hypothetical protein
MSLYCAFAVELAKKGDNMNKPTNITYPTIRKGEGGFWHAYGKGWAVCASTQIAVMQKYEEMLKLMGELIARPLPTKEASDIL